MTALAILAVPAAPLLLAALFGLPALRPVLWRLVPLAALPALGAAFLLPVPEAVRAEWLIVGAEFGLDPLARLFLAFTALLWIAAGTAARGWMLADARSVSFAVCFLLAMSGNLGLIVAQDALGFYAFFALMSFASYGLVVHARSAEAMGAGRLYIVFVILGELLIFAGLALAVAEAGSHRLADLRAAGMPGLAAAFLLAGFGAKLGVMPLHFWLPPAHGAAPVPASAVLSGAMIKAGLYGIVATLPLGTQVMADHGTVLMAAGLVTVFAAVILGLGHASPKTVLGFSSVSQMGLMALGIGAGLLAPQAWPVLLPVLAFLAAHHALAKGALFLGAGLFGALPQAGPTRPLALALLAIPALALAGLPMTSGATGKEALKDAFAAGSSAWLPWLTVALTLSGLATTLLMARFAVTLWRAAPAAPAGAAPDRLLLPVLGLVAASAALPSVWPAVAGGDATPLLSAGPADPRPILAGVLLAIAAIIHGHAQSVGPEEFLRRCLAPFVAAADRIAAQLRRRRRALRRTARAVPSALVERGNRWRLGQTAIAGLIVLILAIESLTPAPSASAVRITASTPPDVPAEAPAEPLPAAAPQGPPALLPTPDFDLSEP